jgi:hypothetical protein
MHIPSRHLVFAAKLLLAALALMALIAFPARELVPTMPLGTLLWRVAVWFGIGLALLTLLAIGSLQFSQFILRKGGTDAQWFWLSSEPRGLVALRQGRAVDDRPGAPK